MQSLVQIGHLGGVRKSKFFICGDFVNGVTVKVGVAYKTMQLNLGNM